MSFSFKNIFNNIKLLESNKILLILENTYFFHYYQIYSKPNPNIDLSEYIKSVHKLTFIHLKMNSKTDHIIDSLIKIKY